MKRWIQTGFVLLVGMFLLSGCATPLQNAARSGNTTEVQRLLDIGVNVNADLPPALIYAVANNQIDTVKLLLSRGANVNVINQEGDGVLRVAVATGNIELVRLLLDKGADVNAKNPTGRTALTKATGKDRFEIAKLLVDHGADANTKTTDDSWTPLLFAASDGSVETAKLFLDHGANIEAKNNIGATPLMVASDSNTETVQLLLDHSAVVDARENDGWTPMIRAAKYGNSQITKLLLDHGADIDARDTDWQQTALHYAAFNNHIETVKLLLEYGADVNAKNKCGITPAVGANQYGYTTVVGLIANASPEWRKQMLMRRALEQRKLVDAQLMVKKQKILEELGSVSLSDLVGKDDLSNEAMVAALTDKLIEAKNRELPALIMQSTVDRRIALLTLIEKRLVQAQAQIARCNSDAESYVRLGRESDAVASRSLAVAVQAYVSVMKEYQAMLMQS